jgi:hypothetical protein
MIGIALPQSVASYLFTKIKIKTHGILKSDAVVYPIMY